MALIDMGAGDLELCERVAPLMDETPERLEATFRAVPDGLKQRARTLLTELYYAGERCGNVDDEVAAGLDPVSERVARARGDVAAAVAAVRTFVGD